MPLSVGTIIYFVIETLFFAFHLSVIILLIAKRNSDFKGAFFAILRVLFIADFLRYVMITIIQKISLIPAFIPFFQNSDIFAAFTFNFSSYLSAVQFCGHLLMAFNRFTLIWFPLKHHLIWSRNWYTVALIFLPVFQNIWRLNERAIFEYFSETSVTIALVNREAILQTSIVYATIYLSTTAFAAVFNAMAFMKFYFYKKSATNLNVNEKNLLAMSFVVMIAQLLRISYNVSWLIFPSDDEIGIFFNSLVPLLNDIFALSGSVSLMVLSSITRKRYCSFYFCKNFSHIGSVIAPSGSRSHGKTIQGQRIAAHNATVIVPSTI